MTIRLRDYISLPTADMLFTDATNILQDQHTLKIGGGLGVTIKATHSGYLTNGRVYPGVGVRDGTGSWLSQSNGGTSGYDKPILKHHDSHSDPIGRVTAAQYVQLWSGEKFDNDWKFPQQGLNAGSGYIILNGVINDEDAQQKILDSRFKSVSIGADSDKALCSICKENWKGISIFERPPCEHRPGKSYEAEDGEQYSMYLITGKMQYMECSFVNVPANEMAGVISVSQAAGGSFGDSKEEDDAVLVSQDSLGGLTSIKLFDAKGNATELIRKEGEEDKLPYGDKNVKNAPKFTVPPQWDNIKTDTTHGVSNNATEADTASSDSADDSKPCDTVIATNHSKQGMKMPDNDEKKGADDATVTVLQKALEDAQAKAAELDAELANQKKLYDSKVNDFNELSDENKKLLVSYRKELAGRLVQAQVQLKKPVVSSVKDEKTFDEAVTKLADRSIDSLLDSIKDLIPELSVSFKENGLPGFVKDRAQPKAGTQASTKTEGKTLDEDKKEVLSEI